MKILLLHSFFEQNNFEKNSTKTKKRTLERYLLRDIQQQNAPVSYLFASRGITGIFIFVSVIFTELVLVTYRHCDGSDDSSFLVSALLLCNF